MVFRLDADGIIYISRLPGAQETLADAKENFRAITVLWGEQPRPVLV